MKTQKSSLPHTTKKQKSSNKRSLTLVIHTAVGSVSGVLSEPIELLWGHASALGLPGTSAGRGRSRDRLSPGLDLLAVLLLLLLLLLGLVLLVQGLQAQRVRRRGLSWYFERGRLQTLQNVLFMGKAMLIFMLWWVLGRIRFFGARKKKSSFFPGSGKMENDNRYGIKKLQKCIFHFKNSEILKVC